MESKNQSKWINITNRNRFLDTENKQVVAEVVWEADNEKEKNATAWGDEC